MHDRYQETAIPLAHSSYVTVAGTGVISFIERDAGRTVLWLRGEFDLASGRALAEVFARAIAVDDADLVVDLSQVQFLDASTIRIFGRADGVLRDGGRSLRLRSPSSIACRVLDICQLTDLIDLSTAETRPAIGASGIAPELGRSPRIGADRHGTRRVHDKKSRAGAKGRQDRSAVVDSSRSHVEDANSVSRVGF